MWDVQVAVVAVLRAWARNAERCYARHFPLSPGFLAVSVLLGMYRSSSVRLAAGQGCLQLDCTAGAHKLWPSDLVTWWQVSCSATGSMWGFASCLAWEGQRQRYGQTLQVECKVLMFLLAVASLCWPSEDGVGLILTNEA